MRSKTVTLVCCTEHPKSWTIAPFETFYFYSSSHSEVIFRRQRRENLIEPEFIYLNQTPAYAAGVLVLPQLEAAKAKAAGGDTKTQKKNDSVTKTKKKNDSMEVKLIFYQRQARAFRGTSSDRPYRQHCGGEPSTANS